MKKAKLIISMLILIFCEIITAKSQTKKNVLLISVDDMNSDLGVFGNQTVKSPNIDKFAAKSVAFANAYCQFPHCSPSRSSMLTGLRPDKTKVFDLEYHFRQGLPNVVTLPQMFMNNGYFVGRVGKIYHYGNPDDIGTNGLDDKKSWMERVNPAGVDKTALESDLINLTPARKGQLGWAMAFKPDSVGSDHDHTDGKVADEGIAMLKRNKDKPFFIAVGFYKPHCPWISPSKYFDIYNLNQIQLPYVDLGKAKLNYPDLALKSTIPWPNLGLNVHDQKQVKLAYYSSISFVDAQVGRLLDAVKDMGLMENTIIVFWSDHGYLLGEHGLWQKQSLFEESAKCPLIIYDPSNKSKGQISRQIVELLDIYPTLANMTGLKAPSTIDGISLMPLLKKPNSKWSHPAYTQVIRGNLQGHSVRTKNWRYTEWSYGKLGKELYDEVADPKELINLSKNPKYQKTLLELQTLLHAAHPKKVIAGVAIAGTKKKFTD
jgi:iduronate 2-sulfatase